MDTVLKNNILLSFGFFLFFCTHSYSQIIFSDTIQYDGRPKDNLEIAKEFAFCECINEGYEKGKTKINDASPGFLFEVITGSAKFGFKFSDD